MDAGIEKNYPSWLNPNVLNDFIDELRDAGYNIGIAQYIAAYDLILALTAQGEPLNKPERLKTLLGPIFCSSRSEQEDFQQRFDRWVELVCQTDRATDSADVKAQALSEELGKIQRRLPQLNRAFIVIALAGGIFLFLLLEQPIKDDSHRLKQPSPTPQPSVTQSSVIQYCATLPPATQPSPTLPSPTQPSLTQPNSGFPQDWEILLFYFLLTPGIIFLGWRLWWLWRARLFLQRHGTTKQPELHKIAFRDFEQNLFPTIILIHAAQSFRHRIRIPSHELDVDKTIDATFRQGGWLTPVYGIRQVLPEYLFLINRASYPDHQAKYIEEMIERLKHNGVFITSYFFDDDPRISFPSDGKSSPLKLNEIAAKFTQHRLVIVSDIEKLFSTQTGELEPWVSQMTTWDHKAILTPKPFENWGYQELELARQFIVLPATPQGVRSLSQVLHHGSATYVLSEKEQNPLPETLRTRPHYWIERNPPKPEQINTMLNSLQEYLGKDGFYWLSACAVFPELHWNITIYLGNVLKTEESQSLLEVCSLSNLARLPWFRYGYIPDWLRSRLIATLTNKQKHTIRTALQDLLITAVQGSVGRQQLEVAQKHHSFLPKLASSILSLLSRRATKGSPLRDYLFLSFMTGQPKLAVEVLDTFSHLLQKQKTSTPQTRKLTRRRFLKRVGLGSAALLGAIALEQVFQENQTKNNPQPSIEPSPSASEIKLQKFEFQVVNVDATGKIIRCNTNRANFFTENLGNGVTLDMVEIPGGNFVMGSPSTEKGRFDYESPQHNVTIKTFFMGKFTITQQQYQAVMGRNPSRFKGEKRPVEQVSWDDAIAFCDKLSKQTRKTYRLPSEAEWEYACRGWTTTPFYFGETITTDLANYRGTDETIGGTVYNGNYGQGPKGIYRGQTTEVGKFPPNACGLYDMHGNIWEWCQDTWHDNYRGAPDDGSAWVSDDKNNTSRLLRGGSWDFIPRDCRSASRIRLARGVRDNDVGFRVVVVGGARTS